MRRFLLPKVVGLDIDRSALKAVQVSSGGGAYTLRHVGYRRLADGAVVEGEVADEELLASELKEFWDTHSFRSRNVYLGVGNQRVVVRLLNLPRMDEADLAGAIRFEAQDHIPMPVEEAVLDHVVLGPSPEQGDLDRVLLVAAHTEMVQAYISAIRTAGLRPAGVDVKSLSLLRSLLPESLFGDEGATLLLDVASEMTNLLISQGSSPTVARFIPGGADAFVRAGAEANRVTEEEAEDLLSRINLRERGEQEDPEDTLELSGTRSLREGIEGAIQLLAEDVQRSIDYHNSQPFAGEVTQALVSGEGSMIPGFEEYLGGILGVKTDRGRPFQKVEQNKSNVSDEDLRIMEPVMAVAMGIAIEEA
jgi:type IV pilus assembly protein PilM